MTQAQNDGLIAAVHTRLAALEPIELEIRDLSERHAHHAGHGGGGHLSARIVSDAFAGQSRVARHRMVYALVGDLMPNRLHALKLITLTPQEYQAQEGS
ncbi:MAG: BolA family protein [Casimicrobiaceae bacterium]